MNSNWFPQLIANYCRAPVVKSLDPLISATGEACCQSLLHNILKVYGNPRATYSDNGSQFIKGALHEELKRRAVKRMYSPLYSPQSVGLNERMVKVVSVALKASD